MYKSKFNSILKSLTSRILTGKAFYFMFFFALLIGNQLNSRNFIQESDEEIYDRKIQNAKGVALDDFTLNIAKSFLNRPYKAHTLDVNTSEKLVVNLRDFDCSTFVETCIAMGLTYRKNDISFDKFKSYLKRLRYYN
ncbi:MAG: N-acetylmuramoyl-L-alanine amidase-like domain-containing protein, partial [Bacteroidota bacterium]